MTDDGCKADVTDDGYEAGVTNDGCEVGVERVVTVKHKSVRIVCKSISSSGENETQADLSN